MTAQQVVDTVVRGGVLPIVRLPNLDAVPQMADVLLAEGVTAFEVTLTSPGALDWVRRLRAERAEFSDGRAALGVGSVVSPQQAEEALDAGAQLIVTPVLNLETIRVCVARGVPITPGALTPTEIQTAWEAGAALVKVFPANRLGPGYLKDVLAPLPHLKLLPTGGITAENAGDYIRAGAAALGAGSNLVNPQWVAAGAWDKMAAAAREMLQAVQAARAKP
jgi:2-dehydro-3-deoxyphosphogluconate aldolase/(4S)-4-hydroxy-2-oxoglutarate aldolase